VICPMVNTPGDAFALTQACLYPPSGQRSNGPVRAGGYGGVTPYLETANRDVSIFPQIETRAAVENIDLILDTPGVNGIYVGPSDLGLSLGLSATLDREEPEVLAIYRTLIEATSRRGQVAGIHNASPTYAARMIDMGFRLVTVCSDSGLLARGARTAASAARTSGADRSA
jgi:4-hydroxy-2-oxoheptanedioate aldolase